jgi:hypothetical protein
MEILLFSLTLCITSIGVSVHGWEAHGMLWMRVKNCGAQQRKNTASQESLLSLPPLPVWRNLSGRTWLSHMNHPAVGWDLTAINRMVGECRAAPAPLGRTSASLHMYKGYFEVRWVYKLDIMPT